MSKLVIALIIVTAILVGGLMSLLRGRGPIASPEVLERAKQRNREIEAKERATGED